MTSNLKNNSIAQLSKKYFGDEKYAGSVAVELMNASRQHCTEAIDAAQNTDDLGAHVAAGADIYAVALVHACNEIACLENKINNLENTIAFHEGKNVS